MSQVEYTKFIIKALQGLGTGCWFTEDQIQQTLINQNPSLSFNLPSFQEALASGVPGGRWFRCVFNVEVESVDDNICGETGGDGDQRAYIDNCLCTDPKFDGCAPIDPPTTPVVTVEQTRYRLNVNMVQFRYSNIQYLPKYSEMYVKLGCQMTSRGPLDPFCDPKLGGGSLLEASTICRQRCTDDLNIFRCNVGASCTCSKTLVNPPVYDTKPYSGCRNGCT